MKETSPYTTIIEVCWAQKPEEMPDPSDVVSHIKQLVVMLFKSIIFCCILMFYFSYRNPQTL